MVTVSRGSTVDSGSIVACNDDTAFSVSSRATFDALQGRTYWIGVHAGSLDQGAISLSISAVLGACADGFEDVPAGQWFSDAVTWAACTGLTTGTSATMFSPNAVLSRAQMATFLWRAAGSPPSSADHPFTDVPDGTYYSEPVAWLAESGITTGTSATTFSPHLPVTRAQMATFLWRFEGMPAVGGFHPFTDVPDGMYYSEPVTWMADAGITTGTSATTFSPHLPVTRAQAVTFLSRLAGN